MDDAARISTHDTAQRLSNSPRWPILARLSDVSPETPTTRPTGHATLGGTNYRFDPPQAAEAKNQSAIYNDIRRDTASTEIQTSGKTLRRHQPHVFDRGRATSRATGSPRRDSPILPRSNPFSNPRPRLIDSLAPTVRFLTMVALFTAAGTWFQLNRSASPRADKMEIPKTAQQPPLAPTKSAVDQPHPAPSAAGPLETNPQTGARVGRANGDDFASGGKSAAVVYPTEHPTVSPPHYLIAGQRLPQVQVGELPKVANGESAASNESSELNSSSEEAPAVARYPGFLIEIPTR